MDEKLELLNYISVERLQEIQDGFGKLIGVGTGITDEHGSALTESLDMCEFCKYTRTFQLGEERCRKCDSEGAARAFREGKSVSYTCHAGLIDFAAPIMIGGKLVGCFAGGQVRVGEPDVERVMQTAKDLGVDPEMYLALARRVHEISEDELRKATEFIYTITHSISDMAYQQYQLEKAKGEVEYAAKLKADFLANMSHEIRTPMNGVIGMAELALREDLPPAAREYINQIKVSGKTLLTIINDILDFSKIESGKMDILVDEYEPLSIVNDVANVILTRIGDKRVELVLDVDVNLPAKLFGDNIRIKQVLLNLANNAVKFTETGCVHVSLGYVWNNEDEVELEVSVQDTGIGITEENVKKLFQSFQQVDSKRNRQVEGTGLGLAISKQLVELMQGEIGVESTYGEGSRFWFHLPQKVFKKEPSIIVRDADRINALCAVDNEFLKKQLKNDIEQMGGNFTAVSKLGAVTQEMLKGVNYLFVDETSSPGKIESIANLHADLTIVVIIDFRSHVEFVQQNIVILKKPIFALNLANLFNHVVNSQEYGAQDEDFMFIAPEAHILIVDDNAVNLTVAVGLLKPLQMQVDTAFSGKEAIEKIEQNKYDLIFMDHMMPELDGVETTRIIRRFHPEYNEVPIIALTANVVSGTKEVFIQEGMNDFVAKPIEIKSIVSKLHKWLPNEKQTRVGSLAANMGKGVQSSLVIEGLDTKYAMNLLGSEELYLTTLKDYYRGISKTAAQIEKLFNEGDWGNYTIEVHALKSASKQIGALELSDMAAEMEKAGNARDIDRIREENSGMLQMYRSYYDILQPICQEEEETTDKPPVDEKILGELLTKLMAAMDDLDMDEMERIVGEIIQYSYDETRKELVEDLRESVEEIDVDTAAQLARKLMDTLVDGR